MAQPGGASFRVTALAAGRLRYALGLDLVLAQIIGRAARAAVVREGREFAEGCHKPDQVLFRMRPERWLSADFSRYDSAVDAAAAPLGGTSA
jgi:hypothetical protein